MDDQNRGLTRAGLRRPFLFALVGAFGTLLNTAILYGLTRLGLFYLVAAAIATEAAIVSNFFGNNHLTFRDSANPAPRWQKFLKFQGVSMAALLSTLLVLWGLTSAFGLRLLLVWNLLAITVSFCINYLLNLRYTWANRAQPNGSLTKGNAAAKAGRAAHD